MADISIGAAVGAGFGLISKRPLMVLLWGAVMTVMLVAGFATMAPVFVTMFTQIVQAAGSGHAASPPDLTAVNKLQGIANLINFADVFVITILNCAAYRSVIHPDRNTFAYLRIGGAELMLFGITVVGYIAYFVGIFIVVLPAALIIGIAAAMHAVVVAVIVGVLFVVAGAWAAVYLALRFTMLGPMIVDDGQVHFLDAWALTKGKVGSLFLIVLSLIGIFLLGEIVLIIVAAVLALSVMSAAAGGMQAIPTLFQGPPAGVLSRLTPLLVGGGLLAIPLYGAVIAIGSAPWARAYLDLRHDPAEAF